MQILRPTTVIAKRLFILVISGLLVSCQLADKSSKDRPQVRDISVEALENQNLQIDRAVALLEKGQEQKARLLIDEVLILNAQHPTATLLNRQLNEPVEKIFSTKKTFRYTVKNGDSLGRIANRWLGNSLYFVSIAKLNGIKNPSRVSPGVQLKIPLTQTGQSILKQNDRSTANVKLLAQYRQKAQLLAGLKKANTLFVLDKDLKKLYHEQQLLLDEYAKKSEQLFDKKHMLKNVSEISESARNQQQKDIYRRFIKAQHRLLVIQESQSLFESQEYLEAAKKLVEAKSLDKNVTRQTSIFRMESLLINKLHEQAIVFYRNHSLEKALGRWDLILKLNPDHALAGKYKVRTEKLLQKLDQY